MRLYFGFDSVNSFVLINLHISVNHYLNSCILIEENISYVICTNLAILVRPQCCNLYKYQHITTRPYDNVIIPPHNEVVWAYVGFTLSVHPSVRLSVLHSMSALQCLEFWLDPFHIYTSYQATSEGLSLIKFLQNFKIWIFSNFLKFDVNH